MVKGEWVWKRCDAPPQASHPLCIPVHTCTLHCIPRVHQPAIWQANHLFAPRTHTDKATNCVPSCTHACTLHCTDSDKLPPLHPQTRTHACYSAGCRWSLVPSMAAPSSASETCCVPKGFEVWLEGWAQPWPGEHRLLCMLAARSWHLGMAAARIA